MTDEDKFLGLKIGDKFKGGVVVEIEGGYCGPQYKMIKVRFNNDSHTKTEKRYLLHACTKLVTEVN